MIGAHIKMKAIALDLDGTTLNHAGEFPNSLIKTLQDIHNKGIKIIIATGRSLQMIHQKVPNDVPVDGFVAASGMTVYLGDTLLSRTAFTKEQVSFVLEEVRKHKIYYEITTSQSGGPYTYNDDYDYALEDLTAQADETVLDYENIGTARTLNSQEQWVDNHALDTNDIIKFYFFSNDKNKMDNWYDYLNNHFTSDAGFQIYRTSNHNSEIMVYGTDKGSGLKTIARELKLPLHDIHAFGDSMNDIPMFKVVGKSTALKNGQEDVKCLADDVTDFTCDEDGLEIYLKKHYL